MPVIEGSDLPESFFQALVETSVYAFLQDIFDADASPHVTKVMEDINTKYPHRDPYSLLTTFIRIQRSDYVRTDGEIQRSAEFTAIDRAADAVAQERIYALLGVDAALIREAKSYFQEREANRPK
jgi:hypothetical protein